MASDRPRLLFLLPCAVDSPRGNATTAHRLARNLEGAGYACELRELSQAQEPSPPTADFAAIIALHAGHVGPGAAALAAQWACPLLILFTGTDLNGKPTAATTAAVAAADAVVALSRAAARRARDLFPDCRDRLEVIPQAVDALPYKPGLRLPPEAPALASEDQLILVPAGIRPVKDPLRSVTALDAVAEDHPRLRLWFIGPILDPACGQALQEACDARPWAHLLPPCPRPKLLPFYRRANVVLSTSRSEGGAPNSLLEAALVGRPLLASDIPAHREFPGSPFLFRDDSELRRKLRQMLDAPDRAMMEARKLQEMARQSHSLAAETLAWDRLLHRLLAPA